MCGIAGRIGGLPLQPAAAERVVEALRHRGPDARGAWSEDDAVLLHCRLRVLDLSPSADQPMAYAAERRVIGVYNGEIYNFRELRAELERSGRSFRTESDTEVLLAGYLTWGEAFFQRARGMWAAAIWEPAARRLVLARDPLGKKPLFYHHRGASLAFASSLGALLPLLDRRPGLDPTAVDCYLGHLVVPFEHCAFQDIHKLVPGSLLTWTSPGMPAVRRYWQLPDCPTLALTGEAAAGEVERLLRQAIRRRLVADVPVGVFLSAGYDSGLVAALAAEESGRRLIAVTAGTRNDPGDERPEAALVAEAYGLEHRKLEVPPASAADLPRLIAEAGEPFGDPSILPSYQVARRAREEMTVALTGDGGDEAFFGYATFRGVQWAQAYRRWTPAPLRRLLGFATRNATTDGWRRRAGALLEYGSQALAASYRNRMGFAARDRALLLRSLSPGHSAEHIYRERLERWSHLPDADALRRTFFETYLPNDYLVKVDTATMAASLEARSPFLDVDLAEFMLRLPTDTAFPGARLKALLRPLAFRKLPAPLRRRRKSGFGIPIAQWLRGPLRPALDEFVYREGTSLGNLIDLNVVRRFDQAHRSGADHATRLWSILALGVWCAVMVDRSWSATDPLPTRSAAGALA